MVCYVLRCATVCYGVLRCATVCYSVLRCATVCYGSMCYVLRCATVCYLLTVIMSVVISVLMRIDECLREVDSIRVELVRRQHKVEGQKEELLAIRGYVELQSKTIYIFN